MRDAIWVGFVVVLLLGLKWLDHRQPDPATTAYTRGYAAACDSVRADGSPMTVRKWMLAELDAGKQPYTITVYASNGRDTLYQMHANFTWGDRR